MHDLKARPNHKEYLAVLRRMTPQQRLAKVFELSAFARGLFTHGLRKRLAHLNEEEFRKVLLARLEKCHNRNY